VTRGPIIGLDFDNTLVTYDEVLHQAALERGLISPDVPLNKRLVRDRIRERPDGEIAWQRLQGAVYGRLMDRATLVAGVAEFVAACRRAGIPLFIVSHKTEYGHYDETRTNLRDAALAWMTSQGFFEADGLAFRREHVFFESTRDEKIARIVALGCTDFVDDLEEVFEAPGFPPAVAKILYAPDRADAMRAGARVMRSWKQIGEHYFSAGD
jgi:hypothetical protein